MWYPSCTHRSRSLKSLPQLLQPYLSKGLPSSNCRSIATSVNIPGENYFFSQGFGLGSRISSPSSSFYGRVSIEQRNILRRFSSARKQLLPQHMADIRGRCLRFLDQEAHSETKWGLLQRSTDLEKTLEIAYYTGHTNEDIITTRGRLRFPDVEPEEVLDLIMNLHKRPEWDSQMSAGQVHVQYDETDADLAYLTYRGAPPMVLPRDLCLLRAWYVKPGDWCILVAHSVVDDSIPEKPGFIRAELKECGYVMKRVSDSGHLCTEVTYISSTDLKGLIPVSFANIILKQQPGTLIAMRDLLKKRQEQVN